MSSVDLEPSSPVYARELLMPLKELESSIDEFSSNISMQNISSSNDVPNFNKKLFKIIYLVNQPPMAPDGVTKKDHAIRKKEILVAVKSIYDQSSISTMKEQLDNPESNQENLIQLVSENGNLDNWVTIIEFVTNHLDAKILANLRKAYSILETQNGDNIDLLLEEVTICIEIIIKYCEINRKMLLKINKIHNTALAPLMIQNLNKVEELISETDAKSQLELQTHE